MCVCAFFVLFFDMYEWVLKVMFRKSIMAFMTPLEPALLPLGALYIRSKLQAQYLLFPLPLVIWVSL